MGFTQNYEWGKIEWLTDQGRGSGDALDIGITTIHPGHAQDRHIHYGDEQWLYVLSGKGISIVDQNKSNVSVGDFLKIPAGSAHETQNNGSEPLVEFLISYPKQLDEQRQDSSHFKTNSDLVNVSDVPLQLSDSDIETIHAYGETLSLPITIYDTGGNPLYTWSEFPNACHALCNISETLDNCHLYKQNVYYSSPAYSEQSAHYCKFGLAVLDTPILSGNKMIGNIRGGHILTEYDPEYMHPELKKHMKNLANIPKGRLRIVLMQYLKLAKNLALKHADQVIKEHNTKGAQPNTSTDDLKEDLNLALEKILNIQMNNHFLFNTLNAIAGLALDENSFKTYRAVVDLSKLFRYNLRSSQEFVTLNEECNYIQNYVDLQRIRFGDRLVVDMEISESAKKHYVPFNTLQPLIENAFVHGFSEHQGEMYIQIFIDADSNNLNIRVKDNGCGISQKTKKQMIKSIESPRLPRRGLSMIIDRLHLFFGQNFSYDIESTEGQGFDIKLLIPKRTMRTEMLR